MVIPKRWMVERTFGWLNRYRRLSKDYELLPQTSEALIQVTMIQLMIRRLAKIASYLTPCEVSPYFIKLMELCR
jgi:putative transposase